jgi:two-component system sensor kinase FixL
VTEPAEFSLQERSGLFGALLATEVDGIVVIDPDGRVMAYNPACEKLFGYRAGEVLGRNVNLLMPEPDHSSHDEYIANYRRTGAKRIIGIGREVRGRRKDGTTFPMYLSVGEGGLENTRFFVGIIRDLTELKREVEWRAGADRLLAQLVQSSDDAIISKTLDGTITSWNPSAERIFGYSAREAIGRHISFIFPSDRLAEEDELMTRLKAGERVDHYETVRLAKGGREVTVSLSVAPIRDRSGEIVGASKIARDVTAKKLAEASALSMQSELIHVSRLSAMGQMSAAIAHELNQPLTAISNYANAVQRMLQMEKLPPPMMIRAREITGKVAAQAIRAGDIIRYLRDFVEKREHERAADDLNDVVREAVKLSMMGRASSNVTVRLDLAQGLPLIPMDKVQIQQVLVNLIRNAIEAMANSDLRELAISTFSEGSSACLLVRDTGPGFAPEVAGRLFQPFVTTKADGMGIGLRICQSIVEAHRGNIKALNEPRGAAFLIHLPLDG